MEDFGKQVSDIIYSEHFIISAMGLTGNMEDAKDLLHDAALRAFRFRDKFTGGNLHGWVYMIMKNCFINTYRLASKRKTIYHPSPELISTEYTEPEVYQQLEDERVRIAVEAIDTNNAESIILHLDGYKYHEIAGIIGAPVGTIKSRIFNGKKQLKQLL